MKEDHQVVDESNYSKECFDSIFDQKHTESSLSKNDNYNQFDPCENNSEKKIEEEPVENNKEEHVKNNKEEPLQNSTEKSSKNNTEKSSQDITEKSLQNNKEEPFQKMMEISLQNNNEEPLQNITEETKKCTEKNIEFKPTKNLLNEKNNPINNKQKRQTQTIKNINEKIIYSNNNNKENIEEILNNGNLNNINRVMANKGIRSKNKLKTQKSGLFETHKQRGPKKKNEKKKCIHNSNSKDNRMDKAGRFFVNSIRRSLNYRCQRYRFNRLAKIAFKKLFGSARESHKRFLEMRMKVVFVFQSNHNKKNYI